MIKCFYSVSRFIRPSCVCVCVLVCVCSCACVCAHACIPTLDRTCALITAGVIGVDCFV